MATKRQSARSNRSNQSKKTLYLIDSSIYVFRAWHTLPDSIRSPRDEPVNALYGFLDFLAQLYEQTASEHIVCAFDRSLATSARNRIYPAYKANRDPAPEDLNHQFALCQRAVDLLGFKQFARARYEADDIIGTLAATAARRGFDSCIVSADKDLAQFIGERDVYWNFAKGERLNAKAIEKKFGVKPHQIADLLAICGDKVDNIPGIPGVGMATAAKLLKKWHTLDNLFENKELVADMKFRGAARVAGLLDRHEPDVRLARQLTGLLPVKDLPVSMRLLKRESDNLAGFTRFLKRQGFSERRIERLTQTFSSP